jgi:hypothetical protein
MVALEPLNDIEETLNVRVLRDDWRGLAKAALPEDMLRHDAQRLRILLARHYLHTGSEPAHRILEHWRELPCRNSSRSCRWITGEPCRTCSSQGARRASRRKAGVAVGA